MKSSFVIFTAAVLACQLHAADAEKPERPAGAEAARRPAAAGGAAGGQVAFERVLTEEQRQQMREFIQAQGAPVRENQQKAVQLRRELQEAAFNGKADAKFIKDKTDEIARLESEQLRVRTMALAKVAASFTPEQRAQIKEMTERVNAVRAPLGGKREGEGEAPRRREPAAPAPPEK